MQKKKKLCWWISNHISSRSLENQLGNTVKPNSSRLRSEYMYTLKSRDSVLPVIPNPHYKVQTSFAIFTAVNIKIRVTLSSLNLGHISFPSSLIYKPIVNSSRPKQLKETPSASAWDLNLLCLLAATMKQHHREQKQTNKRRTLDRLCSRSGLLLSVVCCIALIHAELRIQEHHRLISYSVAFCDNMETEILRKVQRNYKGWKVKESVRHWQATKGTFLTM